MKFDSLLLSGAYLIGIEPHGDHRGFFARLFCQKEFAAKGLETHFVQINNSLSQARGTLRGMHYQLGTAAEVKLVRCIRGAIFDVIIDLRRDSITFGKWFGTELSAESRLMMYIPSGFAHGYLTIEDNTEIIYFVNNFYSPSHERGLRFDDPYFGICWPFSPVEISAKDRAWPLYDGAHGRST